MRQYLELMQHVLEQGHKKSDRTGTGTLSVFGYQMRFNLGDGVLLIIDLFCQTGLKVNFFVLVLQSFVSIL